MRSLDHSLEHLRGVNHSRYLIAYKPADFVPNGQYRPIQVIAQKDGRRLRVQIRKGYFARLATASADSTADRPSSLR